MDENKKWDLTIRTLSGEASAEEITALETWLSAHPANLEFYEEVKSLWNDSASLLTYRDYGKEKEEEYRALQDRIKAAEMEPIRLMALEKKEKVFGWLKIAASWLFISIAAFSAYWFINRQKSNDQNQWLTIRNEIGKKSKILLPDSSMVWLNANSSLRYPRQFPSRHRDVVLSGEAFFEVKENPKSPFTVVSANVATRVVGTSFNVKAYKEEDIEVTVATGSVSVSSFDTLSTQTIHSVALTPNQKIVFDTEGQQFLAVQPSPSHVAYGWKEGRLIFRGVGFGEVARTLERWYGVHFVLQDETIADIKLTAVFQSGASLEKVLKTLALTNKMTFDQKSPTEIEVRRASKQRPSSK
jgi:transmembrane sensor